MSATEKFFYSTKDIAEEIGESVAVIRFWERNFPFLKNNKKNHKYTKEDLISFQKIHFLIRKKGFSVKGAKKQITSKTPDFFLLQNLMELKNFFEKIIKDNES